MFAYLFGEAGLRVDPWHICRSNSAKKGHMTSFYVKKEFLGNGHKLRWSRASGWDLSRSSWCFQGITGQDVQRGTFAHRHCVRCPVGCGCCRLNHCGSLANFIAYCPADMFKFLSPSKKLRTNSRARSVNKSTRRIQISAQTFARKAVPAIKMNQGRSFED